MRARAVAKVEGGRKVTDPALLRHLAAQGVDSDYVEFVADYVAAHPYQKTYRDRKTGQRFAVISALPMVDRGAPCLARWFADGPGYIAGPNAFRCTVYPDGSVEVLEFAAAARRAFWKPTLLLDSKEVRTEAGPVLLPVDPENPGYLENVLEWDYGICRRWLRLIEGAVLELWVFDEDPEGTITIVSNAAGNLPEAGAYAVDARGAPLVGFDGSEEKKVVPASAWDSVAYPVTVDGSYTLYSSASDGTLAGHSGSNYSYARNSLTGYVWNTDQEIYVGQSVSGASWYVYRGALFFDTSGVAQTVLTGTLSLYGKTDASMVDFNIVIQNGQPTYPHDPLVAGDYNCAHYSGNGGQLTTVGWKTNGYNDIPLYADGLSWLNLAGTTKLCLRSSRDIAGTVPGEGVGEHVAFWASEKGTGYKPKLILTYNVPPNVPGSLLCEGATNPAAVTNGAPEFSAVCVDPDEGDTLTEARIQLSSQDDFDIVMWDSWWLDIVDFLEGTRCADIAYGGAPFSLNGTLYYWRIAFKDQWGQEGAWSDAAHFRMIRTLSVSDSGQGQEGTPVIAAQVPVVDAGVGSEAVPSVAVPLPTIVDEGQGEEPALILNDMRVLFDAGKGFEAILPLVKGVFVFDFGLGLEAIASVHASIPVTDAGVGLELAGILNWRPLLAKTITYPKDTTLKVPTGDATVKYE